jgi:RecJ-like exonuclease
MFRSALLSLIFLPAVVCAVSNERGQQPSAYIMCKNKKSVRTIRVEKAHNERQWVTYYTKLGVDQEVARAQSFTNITRIVENIKENLTKANWQCKELKKANAIKGA